MSDPQPFAPQDPQQPDRSSASGFSMLALHSADRMTRSLSPWTRQMLGDDNGLGMVRRTSLNRLLARGSHGSVSFPSTLAILRRFHRIVTRSVAWKADVGSVSPNLFERFTTDLVARREIGANNIGALISLGEQRRREMEMPLAGVPGSDAAAAATGTSPAVGTGSSATSSAQNPFTGEDGKPLTMDDIRKRIEDARRFKSSSLGSQPDFVRATEKDKPTPPEQSMPPTPPGQPTPPVLGQRSPFPQPAMPLPPQQPSPQVTPPTDNSAERQIPPRSRRRRFASVEYVSMPNMDDEESGGTQDDSDPSFRSGYDTGPPGTPINTPMRGLDLFPDIVEKPQRVKRVQPAMPTSGQRYVLSSTPQRRAHVSHTQQQGLEPLRRVSASTYSTGRGATLIDRPFARLTDSMSGQMLISRPHLLMAQVLRKESLSQDQTPTVAGRSAWTQNRTVVEGDQVERRRDPLSLSAVEFALRGNQSTRPRLLLEDRRPLPISPDDFALPYLARLRHQQAVDDTGETKIVDADLAPLSMSGVATLARKPSVIISSRRTLQPSDQTSPRSDFKPTTRVVDAVRRQPSDLQPIRRETRLAQLQVASLSPTPVPRTSKMMPVSAGPRLIPEQVTAQERMPVRKRMTLTPMVDSQSTVPTAQRAPNDLPAADGFLERRRLARSVSAFPVAYVPPSLRQERIEERIVRATSKQLDANAHVDANALVASNASPMYRALGHLGEALSGRLLASRPQTLMRQILQREPAPVHSRGQQDDSLLSPPGLNSIPLQLESPQMATEALPTSYLLPISADDFVFASLPSVHTWDESDSEDEQAELQTGSEQVVRTNPVRRTDEPRASSVASPSISAAKPERRAIMRSVVAPNTTLHSPTPQRRRHIPLLAPSAYSKPPAPRATLAQLQLAPLDRNARVSRRSMPLNTISTDLSTRPGDSLAAHPTRLMEPTEQTAPHLGVQGTQSPSFLAYQVSSFEPTSNLWRSAQMRSPSAMIMPQDRVLETPLLPNFERRAVQRSIQHGQAQLMPLAQMASRLLGESAVEAVETGANPSLHAVERGMPLVSMQAEPPIVAPDRLVGHMEEGGWRFKRSVRAAPSTATDVKRSVESLGRRQSRPLARPVRTLMERVLGRDFAGVRIQTAALGALGVEAATSGGTVYLSPETTRLDRPQSLAVLAHELTHVAARDKGSKPVVQRREVSRLANSGFQYGLEPADPALPLHLTRQLSQNLARMSLSREEQTAEQVERAVAGLATSVYIARRFAPVSQTWQAPSTQAASLAGEGPEVPDPNRLAHRTDKLQPDRMRGQDPQTMAPVRFGDRSTLVDNLVSADADNATVKALLEPGSLSLETLSSSDLVQRNFGPISKAQPTLPLANIVLSRIGAQQEVRASQPPLAISPSSSSHSRQTASQPLERAVSQLQSIPGAVQRHIQPPPIRTGVGPPQHSVHILSHQADTHSKAVTSRPAEIAVPRIRSIPKAVQRRNQPPSPTHVEVMRQRRQAVRSLGQRGERYHRFEPSSALWRSALLASPPPGDENTRFVSTPVSSTTVQRRTHHFHDDSQTVESVAELLTPGQLTRETLTQSSLLQPARMRATEGSLSHIQMPLAPGSSLSYPVQRAAIQVTDPTSVAATVARLPQIRQSEQLVTLQVDRAHPTASLNQQRYEEEQQVVPPSTHSQPAHRTARLIRRSKAVAAKQATLLERVVARDFVGVAPEPVVHGSQRPVSDSFRRTLPTVPRGDAAGFEDPKPFAQEIIQRSIEVSGQPEVTTKARHRNGRLWMDSSQPLTKQVLRRDFSGVRASTFAPVALESSDPGRAPFSALGVAHRELLDSTRMPAADLLRLPENRANVEALIEQRNRVEPLLLATLQRSVPVSDSDGGPVSEILDPPRHEQVTRRLSHQLVQMSLSPRQQHTAERVVQSMASLANAATAARRFMPVSHAWRTPFGEERVQRSESTWQSMADLQLGNSPSLSDPSPVRLQSQRVLPDMDLSERPGSALFRQSLRNEEPDQVAAPTTITEAVSSLEAQGWRFKRADAPRLTAPDRVQRAVEQLQRSTDRGMPLPRQPRTLMERVLQRDFSRVRLQTAPVHSIGVEAAARDNTVFLARDQATQLDRPENLALLGHELTHVAASGNAPVRRSVAATGEGAILSTANGQTSDPGRTLPLRRILPTTIQRSLSGEETVAAQVEQGLRTFLRQSSAESHEESPGTVTSHQNTGVQRSTTQTSQGIAVQGKALAATPHTRGEREDSPRIRRAAVVNPGGEHTAALPLSRAHLHGFRGGEPVLSGVPQISMNLAPKTPIVRRSPIQESANSAGSSLSSDSRTNDNDLSSLLSSSSVSSPSELVAQRAVDSASQPLSPKAQSTSVAPSATTSSTFDSQFDEEEGHTDADWKLLADKVYPLIKRMLLIERERMPR